MCAKVVCGDIYDCVPIQRFHASDTEGLFSASWSGTNPHISRMKLFCRIKTVGVKSLVKACKMAVKLGLNPQLTGLFISAFCQGNISCH